MGCAPPVFMWMISKNMFKSEFFECDLAVLPQSQKHASLPGADPQPGHLLLATVRKHPEEGLSLAVQGAIHQKGVGFLI